MISIRSSKSSPISIRRYRTIREGVGGLEGKRGGQWVWYVPRKMPNSQLAEAHDIIRSRDLPTQEYVVPKSMPIAGATV